MIAGRAEDCNKSESVFRGPCEVYRNKREKRVAAAI